MRLGNDKIKDVFSSKLGDFEPEVPGGTWEKIAKKLPAENVVSSARQSKNVSLYRKISVGIGAVAAVILCFILFMPSNDDAIQLSDNSPMEQHPVVIKGSKVESILTESIGVEPQKKLTVKKDKLVASASHIKYSRPTSTVSEKVFDEENEESYEKIADNIKTNESLSENNQPVEEEANIRAKIEQFANSGNADLFGKSEKNRKTKIRGFSLSLGGNTGLSKGNDDRTTAQNVFALSSSDNKAGKYIPVKMDHRQPVSFGLVVSKDISSKISLETGLVYTYLSSKARTDRTSETKRYDSQIFHYLGVPLTVNYNFAEFHKAKFYVSGGGMVQKDIQGRLKGTQKEIIFQGEAESEFKEEIEQKNAQFSVSGKLGATYPLYNKLHAYGTVGGAYYFDAGNDYNTIYSDRKFQLDINIGLKFKF